MKQHWQKINEKAITISDTPEDLWRRACEYFQWCDENPIATKEAIKSGKMTGSTVVQEYARPYSIKGLCLHCGITEEYIRDIRYANDKESPFYIVISKILYLIHTQLLEYATVGVFNPIFTAKILNVDKEEVPASSVRVEIVGGLPELSTSENEILEKMEIENGTFRNSKEQNTQESNLGTSNY